jgi:NhaP-type Na+/H+ or K+/H+ antiporter
VIDKLGRAVVVVLFGLLCGLVIGLGAVVLQAGLYAVQQIQIDRLDVD